MGTERQDTIRTLENIELLAIAGTIGNPLTDIMARMHITELKYMQETTDALERALAFIQSVKRTAKG